MSSGITGPSGAANNVEFLGRHGRADENHCGHARHRVIDAGRHIEVALGDNRYTVVVGHGVLETRCAKAVRGVVLKTEDLPLEGWLEALGRELAVEAEASEQSREALDQLLRG